MTTPHPPMPDAMIARRQLQIVMLLDCSGSMAGEKIASLNYAIRSALSELRKVASENPEVDLRLSAVRISSEATWHLEDPTPVADLRWKDIEAGGETAIGQSLQLVTEMFESDRFAGRQLPPVLLLITDGYPTDDFDAAYRDFRKNSIVGHAVRIAVAIGESADMDMLREFLETDTTGIAPLCARNAPDLVRHIKWATTAPVKAASSPTNAPSNHEALAATVTRLNRDDSSIVW